MNNKYPFELEKLPFAVGDLEPVIDKQTVEIHYGKHHQTYVDNLNKLLTDMSELQSKTLEELMKSEVAAVKNNAGGVWNHNFYWNEMKSGGEGNMSTDIEKEIVKKFGSVDEFKTLFEKNALGRFGSGWGWLVKDSDGELEIMSTANQDNPLALGKKPLLGIDVWEHAYYLKYQNRRAEYVKAWWNLVNWDFVGKQ